MLFCYPYRREVKRLDMLQRLNRAVGYVEESLCAEPDVDKAARIACVSADSFMRFSAT